jgi:putative endonuclease
MSQSQDFSQNRSRGEQGEQLCHNYLEQKGFEILEKNYRLKMGELDVIALDKNVLCFIEVKTDFSQNAGNPSAWVTAKKQKQIFKVAQAYLTFKGAKYQNFQMRFDVCAIVWDTNKNHLIQYFSDAFVPVFEY